jgi:hypothetical protein
LTGYVDTTNFPVGEVPVHHHDRQAVGADGLPGGLGVMAAQYETLPTMASTSQFPFPRGTSLSETTRPGRTPSRFSTWSGSLAGIGPTPSGGAAPDAPAE